MLSEVDEVIYYTNTKNKVIIRTAEYSDIEAIASDMRDADKLEVMASHKHTPKEALLNCFSHADIAITILYDGIPAAMFGIEGESLLSDRAVIWFLGANGMDNIKKTFMKLSKFFINMFLDKFPVLFNYVDARYESSIKWLTKCGAVFFDKGHKGHGKEPFKLFFIYREGKQYV